MNSRPTLAIYGIKDRYNYAYPGFTHDHNLCLMQNGKILHYIHLERYTRKKYDNRLDLFIEEIIDNKVIDLPEDFDFVSVNSFVGNAFISVNGRIRFESAINKILSNDLEQGFGYYQKTPWEGKNLNAFNCPHELAHIGSLLPFFGEFKENSLLISFDGGASLGNFSAFYFKNGNIQLLENHWELSYLSKIFNDNALIFRILGAKPSEHCSVPGKLMGYASYGIYDLKIEKWLKENNYYKDAWKKINPILKSIENTFGIKINNFDNRKQIFQNIASTFQYIFERDIIHKIKQLKDQTNAEYLYYSGGGALNIVTNSKIIAKNIFKDVFIPPCCNDSGLSIGAAALLEWKKGNNISIHSPYLNNIGIAECPQRVNRSEIEKTINVLLKMGIVGICNENAEVGPRALGNRSLIALPNNKQLAERLNMEIKKREWYRPVAPIMLSFIAEKVVEEPIHHLAKFMLLDFRVKDEYIKDLEGVVHINKTARIQILYNENENPFMFKLLRLLYEKYNILGLINTSFNTQGEPIVHTPEMAINASKQMNLDGIVINNKFYKL